MQPYVLRWFNFSNNMVSFATVISFLSSQVPVFPLRYLAVSFLFALPSTLRKRLGNLRRTCEWIEFVALIEMYNLNTKIIRRSSRDSSGIYSGVDTGLFARRGVELEELSSALWESQSARVDYHFAEWDAESMPRLWTSDLTYVRAGPIQFSRGRSYFCHPFFSNLRLEIVWRTGRRHLHLL